MADIYVAGSWHSRPRLLEMIQQLEDLGFKVSSTWARKTSKADPTDPVWKPGTEIFEASRDLDETLAANLVIVDTIERSSTGGSDAELGAALTHRRLNSEVQVWIVGPKRSGYHHLGDRDFDTWEQVMEALAWRQNSV